MQWIFQAFSDRLKALFVTQVALDLEAEFTAQHAARQADLLRQADRYAAEGLEGVAASLRERAEALSLDRPMASVLPAAQELYRPVLDGPLPAPRPAFQPPAKPERQALAHPSPKRSKTR